MKRPVLILSCEHAGNQIPKEWQAKVHVPSAVLKTHRGWDPGALQLTTDLAKVGAKKVFIYEWSRLLIELNRSLGHPKLFSEFSECLNDEEKRMLIQNYYMPYRQKVTEVLKRYVNKGFCVWHISMHSFTPVLEGRVRQAEIGILYDPQRSSEREFAKEWQELLVTHMPSTYRVRMNYPYRGIADGFVTWLRKIFPVESYVGVELEVNQGLLEKQGAWELVSTSLTKSMRAMLKERKL